MLSTELSALTIHLLSFVFVSVCVSGCVCVCGVCLCGVCVCGVCVSGIER